MTLTVSTHSWIYLKYSYVLDELAWIREKEQIAASTNRGRDLVGVQNLIKKQQALIAEINNHEPHHEQIASQAEEMIQRGHFLAPDIRDKLAQLRDNWRNLKAKAEKRKQELNDSLQAHQFLSDANEAGKIRREKHLLVIYFLFRLVDARKRACRWIN